MSPTSTDDSYEDDAFDWNKYLKVRNAEEVPEDFFYHVCKSELNGIELGSVVEVENEDSSGYWFASVCSSKGVLINLHYVGDENDKHDFWLEVKSSRIHPLNWGSENDQKLVPPYPDRFARVNPHIIKEKVQHNENVVSEAVLQMGGVPIHNVFKTEMFVEVQDKEYPYRVWVSKVLKNVGGRLFLQMQGASSPEKKPFWLFFLNERIFPFGWAEQKGLPWRVMNLETNFVDSFDSNLLLNVLKPKTPEQHSYKVGDMLEVINPYSLMIFYVATVIKIYDNRYFKVEADNDNDMNKRITFVATKENPYLFNAGWASKHKFLLKPPSDWKISDTFCWSKYITMKNAKCANVDNTCRRKIDIVHIGMKLEAVDPIDPDIIRVATVKGFSDHWMFLSFDRTQWYQGLLHVRSVYSDDIFPVGWCNKHKYSLSVPKLPYNNNCDINGNGYYVSDDNMELDESVEDKLTNNSQYIKGEILYHYTNKGNEFFYDCKDTNIPRKVDVIGPTENLKIEPPELDEAFHDALFSEEEVETIQKEKADVKAKKEIVSENPLKSIYEMSIYFNKDCYTGTRTIKKKVASLPNSIGPGPVSKILQEAIVIFIHLDYFPGSSLKKIKKIQHMLFDQPGGVDVVVTVNGPSRYFENLVLPESKKMAQQFCSALCNLSGMCEYFLTTEQIKCPRNCNVKEKKISKVKSVVENKPTEKIAEKRKAISTRNSPRSKKRKIITEEIAQVELPDSSDFLNSNSSNMGERINEDTSQVEAPDSSDFLNSNSSNMGERINEDTSQVEAPDFLNSITSNMFEGINEDISQIESSDYSDSFNSDFSNMNENTNEENKYKSDCVDFVKSRFKKRIALITDINKTAKKELDWTNKSLVERYKHYLKFIMFKASHTLRLDQKFTHLESAIITEIQSKKNYLRMMDEMDIYSNTKSDLEEINERRLIVHDNWKSTFENFYRQNAKYKENIDIGHLEMIKINSNPKYWSPFDVHRFISRDLYCSDIGMRLLEEECDGVSFMLLNAEQLMKHLNCSINTSIRMLCHVAEVKYVFLTKFSNT